MKTTKAGIVSMVAQLAEIIENRKAQDKVEKELKAVLKEFMGSETMLEAGSHVVILEDRETSTIDRKALTIELGLEAVEKFTKVTAYTMLTVKPANRS